LTIITKPGQTLVLVTRVNVSMVSLKWGEVLSTLLPGALALYAIAPWFALLRDRMSKLDTIGPGTGLVLLMAAALAGGVLEAWTRIVWERFWLIPHCKPPDSLGKLKAENMELYERGVQSSYKYVTFYANFAWAILLLLVSRAYLSGPCTAETLLLGGTAAVLLRASHVQWTYFVNYMTKVFAERKEENAGERPTIGDAGEISKAGQ
jgi:hypothetical protein